MSDALRYERFVWFHSRIKAGKFPNAGDLCEEFEVSERTARRDIDFMRVQMQAPLHYDHSRRGFKYKDDSYELPGHWISETNVLALALAVRLASTIPDPSLKDELCRLIDRVTGITGKKGSACLNRITEKISVKNIEYARVASATFRQAVDALFAGRALHIYYHSPHTNSTSDRTIQPIHLMHYMGSWHLIAWCGKRQALRNFALARIRRIAPADQPLPVPSGLPDFKEYTRRNFGIMQGSSTYQVVLQFAPAISPWIAEQSWHPEQKTTTAPDGSLRLEFPVADFRELLGTILSHGTAVQVIEPEELKDLVGREIDRMAKKYF